MIKYKEIYEKVFDIPHYSKNDDRKISCQLVHDYLSGNEKSVIDIGSGRGPVLIELLTKFENTQILSCDLKKFHDLNVPFEVLDLTAELDKNNILMNYPLFDFLTCMDVLEHIEEKELDDILSFFKLIAKKYLIIVANHSDVWGEELHLIQESMDWWESRLTKYFFSILDKKSIHNNRAYVFYIE
jgi:2-polyprenyl-3-methyl-5-hydroxy-6-metoxy-1,4-benzoquinol methylase